MKFIAQFIHKPIFAIVLSILIVLVGLFGSAKLPIRFLPKINQAYINIHTTYPGANSEIVKNFVTSKIQNAIVGIQGIDYITSTSTTGDSNIGVYLDTDTNPDNVLSGVLGKVSGIQNQLPVGIQTPAITKNNLDSNATMILAFTSNSVPRADIAEYLRRIIEPKLETIDGVSQAQVWADDYAMQIWLDPLKMSAYQLFPTDIVNSLNKYNILSTPGQTRGNYFDYSLSLNSDLHKKEDFNNIPVKINESGIVYLRDVGYAKWNTTIFPDK